MQQNEKFPINRRHQRIATLHARPRRGAAVHRFQSIGVTKEWRLVQMVFSLDVPLWGFQSIGVTKEWRLLQAEREVWDILKVSNQ